MLSKMMSVVMLRVVAPRHLVRHTYYDNTLHYIAAYCEAYCYIFIVMLSVIVSQS